MKALLILATLALVAVSVFASGAGKGNGFGDSYNWESLPDALAAAPSDNKPIMLVIHKSWCGACKRLGPQFADSKEIQSRADKFHMVNTIDDDEPKGAEYAPDGGYIPRILFLEPNGKVRDDLHNPGASQYKYFYPQPSNIAVAMDRAHSAITNGKEL